MFLVTVSFFPVSVFGSFERIIFLNVYIFWRSTESSLYCASHGYEKTRNISNITYETKRILFLFCLPLFLLIATKCEWLIIEILKCADCVER